MVFLLNSHLNQYYWRTLDIRWITQIRMTKPIRALPILLDFRALQALVTAAWKKGNVSYSREKLNTILLSLNYHLKLGEREENQNISLFLPQASKSKIHIFKELHWHHWILQIQFRIQLSTGLLGRPSTKYNQNLQLISRIKKNLTVGRL